MKAKLDAVKDLADLNRALAFARFTLRSELGPGGILEEMNEEQRGAVEQAIDVLRPVEREVSMIALYHWRHPKEEVPE